jgi:hypothetical protein
VCPQGRGSFFQATHITFSCFSRPNHEKALECYRPIGTHAGMWVQPVHCTDKKEKKIFLINKEIQSGPVAKSYIRKGFLINQ